MGELTHDVGEEYCFEPVNDEWVPSSLLKTDPPAFGTGDPDPELAQRLAALDKENRDLKARLAKIESMIHSDAGTDDDSDEGPEPIPPRLSNAPPANEQAAAPNASSTLALQGTMALPNGRPDLRKPIPLAPMEPAEDADEALAEAGAEDMPIYGSDAEEEAAEASADDMPIYGSDADEEAAEASADDMPIYGSDSDDPEEAEASAGDMPIYGSDSDDAEEAEASAEDMPVYGADSDDAEPCELADALEGEDPSDVGVY